MFSKAPKGGDPVDVNASASRKLAVASLIAEGVRLKGDFVTDGDLHLDGALEGDLRVGQLTIGEAGAVSGAIQADSVEIRGRVTGTITARRVRLWATARVDGDITHGELAVEAGARFEGRSLALPPEPTPLSVVAGEYFPPLPDRDRSRSGGGGV